MIPTEYHTRFRWQRLQYTDAELRVMDLEVQGADFISGDNTPIPGEPQNPLHVNAQLQYLTPIVVDPAAPTIVSAVVDGTEILTVHFSIAVEIGSGGSGGFSISVLDVEGPGAGDLTFIAVAPDGMSATFSTENPVLSTQSAIIAYVQPGDGVIGAANGVELASVEGIGVTNKAGAPTIESVTIGADGLTLTVVLSEPVVAGADGFNIWLLEGNGGAAYPAYVSGSGTNTLTLLSPFFPVTMGGGPNKLIYSQTGDAVQDLSGNLLASVVDFPCINNSTVGSADATPPTMVSAAVESNGVTLTIVFSEDVVAGADGWNLWVLTSPVTGDVYPSYVSGLGTDTVTFGFAPKILMGETPVTLIYSQTGDAVKDAAGNLLASAVDFPVTNNSTQV